MVWVCIRHALLKLFDNDFVAFQERWCFLILGRVHESGVGIMVASKRTVLVFTVSVTVITVFTDTFTGVSTVSKVKRPQVDDCWVTGDATPAETCRRGSLLQALQRAAARALVDFADFLMHEKLEHPKCSPCGRWH